MHKRGLSFLLFIRLSTQQKKRLRKLKKRRETRPVAKVGAVSGFPKAA
jgi:hypothetical protein